jgi:hypothetical protein
MDPPSTELVQTLASLGLATATDLRRAGGLARRFGRGLPATDSLWIDALVRRGTLTPFQAEQIETRRPAQLLVDGRFVLRRPRQLDPVLSVYEARALSGGTPRLISRIHCSSDEGHAAAVRLARTVQQLSTVRDSALPAPLEAVWSEGELSLIAPFREGSSLAQLLVRRGRFPEETVRCIGRELARQLSLTESLAAQGDLRPVNVCLTPAGDVQLLNWGLLAAAVPHITIHARLPLDACDGLAPERIESLQPATPLTDAYALGCLLWQLLSGRPPFPTADPLGKFAAHRTRQVPDVRTIAPDVSDSLAQALRSLTAREPHRRPQSFAEVRTLLGNPGSDRARLRQFARSFETAAPLRSASVESPPPSRLTAAAWLIGGTLALAALAFNRDRLGLPELARVAASTQPDASQAPAPPVKSSDAEPEGPGNAEPNAMSRIPAPTPEGIVVLAADARYVPVDLHGGRQLILRGDAQRLAEIRLNGASLSLTADSVRLEHVRIVIDRDAAPECALRIAAQELTILHCWLDDRRPGGNGSLISWQSRSIEDPRSGRLLMADTALLGDSTALTVQSSLRTALFENVFRRGLGPAIALHSGVQQGLRVPVMWNHCTLRDCGPLVRFVAPEALQDAGRLSLQGTGTVISPAPGRPLLDLPPLDALRAWEERIEIAAEELIVPPDLLLAGARADAADRWQTLNPDRMTVDGLITGEFHFDDSSSAERGFGRMQIDALPVQFSAGPPGADPARLPAPPAEF